MKHMMNAPPGIDPEKQALWQRIRDFKLDNPDAALPFSRKLALQQHWTYDYTLEAIAEYRKFIFLCCISPQGASPSKVIDEVWHMHLLYTQNYWEDFCERTLEQKLHHHPSSGGPEQNNRHLHWREDTMQLYKDIFLTTPPPAYWSGYNSATMKKYNPALSRFQKYVPVLIFFPALLLSGCSKNPAWVILLPVFLFLAAIIRSAASIPGNDRDTKKNEGSGSSCSSGGCGSSCGSGCGGGCGGCGS